MITIRKSSPLPRVLSTTTFALALAMTGVPAHGLDFTFSDMGGLADLNNPIFTRGINNLGHVVGEQYFPAENRTNAVVWNGASWRTVANPDGYSNSTAQDINDHGDIVGYSWTQHAVAVRWTDGTPTVLDHFGPANADNNAFSINNAGAAAGFLYDATGYHAIAWEAGGTAVAALPTLGGASSFIYNHEINDAGVIVGVSSTLGDDAWRGTVWNSGTTTGLSTLGGTHSEALGINNLGQIVGNANNADEIRRPVLWNDLNAAPIDLGTLGGPGGMALMINDNGWIAGFSEISEGVAHATLWADGQIIDLTQFIPADLLAAGWQVRPDGQTSITTSDWLDINNQGVILSTLHDANDRAIPFMLTPKAVPVPGAIWLFGSALTGIGIGKRRSARSRV